MAQFAFLKEIFFGLSDFFKWSFQILPMIGYYFDWILVFVGTALLIYWCMRIIGFGKNDERVYDYRQPHNFIDKNDHH